MVQDRKIKGTKARDHDGLTVGGNQLADDPAIEDAAGGGKTPTLMDRVDWDDYRFFVAVAVAGSLSSAARLLQVNTTTVLRRIASLEEGLRLRLFERRRSGYSLTADGAQLMQALEPIEQRLISLGRDLQAGRDETRQIVKIAAGAVISSQILASVWARLMQSHPSIRLDIVPEVPMMGGGGRGLPMRDIDLAIQLVRPTQGDMLVRKIGDLAYGLYAHADYLARYGPVAADLSGHRVIGFLESEAPLGPVWWMSRMERSAEIVARSAIADVRAQAAVAGLGLTALPDLLARHYPGLQRLEAPTAIGGLEIWLLARNDVAKMPHIRHVMDYVIDEVKSQLNA